MKKQSAILIPLFFLCLSAAGKVARFDMRDVGARNVVQFVSDATFEKTVGLSNYLAGWVEFDPDKLSDGMKGEFEVDVRTFNTGLEARNEQFRDKWMDSAEFPTATFSITHLAASSKAKLLDQAPLTLRVEGNLKARGLSRPQTLLMKLTYFRESELTKQRLPGNLLKISATFDVDTAQYNVTIPELLKNRFARFLQVSVDAIATDHVPGTSPLAADNADHTDKSKKQ